MLKRSLAIAAALAAAGIHAQVAAGGAPSVWVDPRGPRRHPAPPNPLQDSARLAAADAKRARRAARNLRSARGA